MTPRRGPRPVVERLRRLLVMLPWLMERREASLTEMAERFQLTEQELIRDLEQAALCGLPPYLDEVIDLFIDDDGMVQVGVPRFFTAPLRLTAPEGFALLASLRAALELPGAEAGGPLARALAKLEAVLGADDMVLDLGQPPATADLAAAVLDRAKVAITYWSASSDQTTERVVTPRAVFSDRGQWYLMADDERSGNERIFRIDRIDAWRATGDHGAVRDVEVPADGAWFEEDDLPAATLRLDPVGQWVIERFPVRSVTADGDDRIVELAVASERWFRHLLLRLGPHATVVAPDEWRDLAATAAAELLAARYAAD